MLNPENLAGQTVGGYKVLEKIAIGGMASIYRAQQESTGRVVVMKVLLSALSRDPLYVERFIREAKIASTLSHPNITSVLDAGTVEGVHYFVMEFIDGVPLDATLSSRGQLFWRDALEIGIQIADALEHAHANGIIHRDVKPDNIIVTADGVAKLTDMGISKSLRADAVSLTTPGIILGTPFYMAPEQAKDSRAVDQRSDIYGLGATLYHMLAGRPPFEGETEQEVVLNLLEKEATPITTIAPYVPKNVCRVVERMMAKNPKRRYQSMNEVLVDLKLVKDSQTPIFLNQLPPDADEATPGASAWPTTRKVAAPAGAVPRPTQPRAPAGATQPASPGTERRAVAVPPARQSAPDKIGTAKRQGRQNAQPAVSAPSASATAPTPVGMKAPVTKVEQDRVEVSPWAYRHRKKSLIGPIVTILFALIAVIAGYKLYKKYVRPRKIDPSQGRGSYIRLVLTPTARANQEAMPPSHLR